MMALIDCPACGHTISVEAAACPQCGHPNREAAPAAPSPKCYSCAAPATTRCQSCGAMSCARHVQSIYIPRNMGGSYELRCESCYQSGEAWQVLVWVLGGMAALIGIVLFLSFARQ